MQRPRPTYQAASAFTNTGHPQDAPSVPCSTPGAHASYSAFGDDFPGAGDELGSLQQFLGLYGEPDSGHANVSNQASSNVDAQRIPLCGQQSPTPYHGSSFANHGEYAGLSRANHQQTESAQHHYLDARSPYNTHGAASGSAPATAPMPTPPDSHSTHTTPYSPYRGLFASSAAAKAHRHTSTRFGRTPYLDPSTDATIAAAEHARAHHVGRIYDAMVRGDRAQDNPNSIAMKRWVHGAHYHADVVEAFAHKVFDCVLGQVREGFRGWHHNDYVDDERKGEREDREADCLARLDNVIEALEREKTICEDVVGSGCQVRMFVNAPVAYAARKYQNRVGNRKRGRGREGEGEGDGGRLGKVRRGGRGRGSARERERERVDDGGWSSSRGVTPCSPRGQSSQTRTGAAVSRQSITSAVVPHQPAVSSPVSHYPPLHTPAWSGLPYGLSYAALSSPQPYDPFATMQQVYGPSPAETSPDNHNHNHNHNQAPTHVSLAEIEHSLPLVDVPAVGVDGGGGGSGGGKIQSLESVAQFETLWSEQAGVQQFGFGSPGVGMRQV